ncbi:hypothetical protein pb186bvf_020158 [Paramecium bursaria]
MYKFSNFISRQYYDKPLSIAIVGAGPAGLYTAKHLYKDVHNINVHIYDKDECPTGLIRYGMAPDHQRIKKVADDLLKIQEFDSCKFFGGVEIVILLINNLKGQDITIENLKDYYSAIFFAYGAQKEKNINIPQNHKNIYSSMQLVNWYNSHPNYYDMKIDLSNVRNICIIGNGNVAIDIARTLGQDIQNLLNTDISDQALEIIKKRSIKNIIIVGRRGLVQSQFTLKELRELGKIQNFKIYLYKPELIASLNDSSVLESKDQGKYYGNDTRANRRKLEFMSEFNIVEDQQTLQRIMDSSTDDINIIFRYLLSPIEFNQEGVLFQGNDLIGEPFKQTVIPNDQIQLIKSDMIVTSIGYQSEMIDSNLIWDTQQQILKNSDGCLVKNDEQIDIGLYSCGWLKTGPKGVIDQTFLSSIGSIINFTNHLEFQQITPKPDPFIQIKRDLNNIKHYDWNSWSQINAYELQKGKEKNKIRDKICDKNVFKQF